MDVLMSLGMAANAARRTVSNIHSPPRITRSAMSHPGLGIHAGFALDLTTIDEFGNSCGFYVLSQRRSDGASSA
eukprot:1914880-Heterocapsa_arctica.AAC.1